jgi:hypothetical protein
MSNDKFKNSPIHDKKVIISMMDELEPKDMIEVVELLKSKQQKPNKEQTAVQKEFIPYELALALKQLGFDEPCIAWYAENKELQIAPDTYKKWSSKACNNSNIISVFNSDCITAPTYSQAFRWFREKYGLYPDIHRIGAGGKFLACIENLITGNSLEMVMDEPVDYEESELASLKKLIEIVKNK